VTFAGVRGTTTAFIRKDAYISARAGALLPGLPTLLFFEGLAFAGAGAWALTVGQAPTPGFWNAAVSTFASISFFLAVLGPMTAGRIGAAQEAVPEIAESLASTPLEPLDLFLGKAMLPMLQGLSVQLTLLPVWGFLWGSGLVGGGTVFRVVGCACAIVPVASVVGATRTGDLRRWGGLSGFRRVQGGPQQFWLLAATMIWSMQSLPALLGAGAAGGFLGSLVAGVRPVLPMLMVGSSPQTTLFRLDLPSFLLTLPLLGVFAVSRLASGLAANPRCTPAERKRSVWVIIGARSMWISYLLAVIWPAGPSTASALAGIAAVVMAMMGIPGSTRREEAVQSARSCLVPAAVTTLVAGPFGLLFWLGTAVLVAAVAAALPAITLENPQRRPLAWSLLFMGSIFAAFGCWWLNQVAILVGPLGSVAAGFVAVSPLAAPASLAQDLFGRVPLWNTLSTSVPLFSTVRPWFAAPALFGCIAGLALWLGARRKR
jgi:hypothetical protein